MGDSTASRIWAFRVEDIPAGTTYEGLKTSFHKDDQPGIQVKSLVPAVDPGLNGGLTATISFEPDAVSVQKPRLLDKNLIIDDKFFGFTPLFHPEGPIVADVIAITGLAGHAFASWAQPTGIMWLRDFLPKDVSNVRVLTYGYNSQLQGNEARSSLLSHSKNFIHRLQEMRKVTGCEKRPVIFVGHSLGCLIIKNVLIEINGFTSTSNMPRLPVPTIVFFGSPNRGLETAELESFVKGTPSQDLVEELRPQSPTLESLNDKFRHVTSGISILSCYEQLKTPTAIRMPDGRWKREGPTKLMVPSYSALLGLPGEESLACEANHTQIAKLRRGENGYYYAVKGAVLKVAGSHTVLLGVVAGGNNIKTSRRFPGNEIRGASRIPGNHRAGKLQARRPSRDRIPEKQVNQTSETDEKTLSQECLVPPDMEIPTQTRTSAIDSSSEDQFTVAPESTIMNPRTASPDPITTASKRFRTVSETSNVHLSKSTSDANFSGKKMLASDPLSQGQLCEAVLRGDIGRVTALLLDGCSPHTSNEEAVELSQDPFLLAAKCREEQILKRFLELDTDPLKHTLEKSETALHMLSTPHDGERKSVTRSLVSLLLRHGALLESRTKDDLTPLMLSARNGEGRVVRHLLDYGADLKAIHYTSGWTLLHWAASCGHRRIVDTLISKGASLEVQDKDGLTPLLEAANRGNVRTLQRLLDHSANLQATTNDGSTALHLAARNNHSGVADWLISRGAPKDAKDKLGLTPLMCVCQTRHTKVLKTLVDLGVNLTASSNSGWTAMHYAANGGNLTAVDLLISNGAHLDARTSSIQHTHATPLHVSTYRSDTSGECTKLILRAGADIEALDLHGRTALFLAACHGAVNPTKELIASKANIEAVQTGPKKHRALHVAKFNGHPKAVEVLLRSGADPFAPAQSGITPSQMGWFEGNENLAAPSETDKDRCMKLLQEGEQAERRNRKRRERDLRFAKKN